MSQTISRKNYQLYLGKIGRSIVNAKDNIESKTSQEIKDIYQFQLIGLSILKAQLEQDIPIDPEQPTVAMDGIRQAFEAAHPQIIESVQQIVNDPDIKKDVENKEECWDAWVLSVMPKKSHEGQRLH